MEFTDEIIVASDVKAATEAPGSFTFRSCIKVKMADGTYSTIIPITNTSSVLGENGELLVDSLKTIVTELSNNSNLLNTLDIDLKSHFEVLDSDEEVNNDIFTHIYDEMDALTKSIQELSENVNKLSSNISSITKDISVISKDVTQIKSDIESHKDTIE